MFEDTNEIRSLAPIEVVMLREAMIMKRCATFERKAGRLFPSCFIVPLLKKSNYLNAG